MRKSLLKLTSRVIRLETQRKDHEQVHVLEDKALTVAFQEMKSHVSDHNGILEKWQSSVAQMVERPWFEKVHKDLEENTDSRFAEQERRIRILEGFHSGESGRQGPISDVVKWVATLLVGVILFLIGHFAWK